MLLNETKGKIRFINHLIEEYALSVSYNPDNNSGKAIFNLSFINESEFEYAVKTFKEIYKVGLCISDRIKFLQPGDDINGFKIPDGKIGVCNLCSLTVDALMIREGVPHNAIGGGVLEVADGECQRFTSMIRYNDTTVDPTELYISQEAVSVSNVIKTGTGYVLANVREFHMDAENMVYNLLDKLTDVGFTGIIDIGPPNLHIFGVPVTSEYQGVVLAGGTNWFAYLQESGHKVKLNAFKGLINFESMDSILEY